MDAKEAGKSHWPLMGRFADRLIVEENRPTHQEIMDRWTRIVDGFETFESCESSARVHVDSSGGSKGKTSGSKGDVSGSKGKARSCRGVARGSEGEIVSGGGGNASGVLLGQTLQGQEAGLPHSLSTSVPSSTRPAGEGGMMSERDSAMDIVRGVDGEARGIDGKDQGVNDTTQGEDDENCEAYSDSKLRNAADWDEWDEAFGCWLAKFSDCRKWLIDGLRPVYEIKEFVPRIAADGRVAMVAGEPIMVPNPLYAGDEGMDKQWEDLDKCEERTEELRVLAARAIGKIWSTASERLRRKIKQQEGYKVSFVSDDRLWFYNVTKKIFDSSRGLVV